MKKYLLVSFVFLFAFTFSANAQEIELISAELDDEFAELEIEVEELLEDVDPHPAADDRDSLVDFDEDDLIEVTSHNKTDVEFLSERAGVVPIRAIEVRGWDPVKKEAFLSEVKKHAELQSQQDLNNFATGILLKDENVTEVSVPEGEVEMRYKIPGKFLGLFNATFPAHITVTTEQTAEENRGKVKVRFPWYRFLYGVPDEVKVERFEEELQEAIDNLEDDGENNQQRQGQMLQTISNVSKAAHDTAMSIIRKI